MSEPKSDARYTMGRSSEETERLIQQSQLYETVTRRFLQDAGIVKGMKILDVGSGSGDLALTVAEMVGQSGKVVGVDVNGEILETARARAKQAGFTNVIFVEGDSRNIELSESFDAVVGRLVLMYMSDPTQALKQLTTHLKPGGIIAFQELDFTTSESLRHPETPLLNKLLQWCVDVFERSGAHLGIGLDLYRIFVEAGLPEPCLHLSAPVGCGETWPGYEYIANTFRSLLPLIQEYEIATSEEVDIDTLAERIRKEVNATKRPVVLTMHVTAWSKLSRASQ